MTTQYYDYSVIEQQKKGEPTEWMTLIAKTNDSLADFYSDLQCNRAGQGIILEVILSDKKNSGSFTPKIVTVDDAGNIITLVAFTALTANGTALYFVHPHADKTATIKNSMTEEGTLALPRDWKLFMDSNGNGTTDSFDIEVHFCYVN